MKNSETDPGLLCPSVLQSPWFASHLMYSSSSEVLLLNKITKGFMQYKVELDYGLNANTQLNTCEEYFPLDTIETGRVQFLQP